jgi:hypothetical protein
MAGACEFIAALPGVRVSRAPKSVVNLAAQIHSGGINPKIRCNPFGPQYV